TPSEKITVLSAIAEEQSYWEQQASNNIPISPCPLCSGHGLCPVDLTRCICDTAWSLSDCSLPSSQFNEAIDLKKEILQELQDSFQQLGKGNNTDIVYNTLVQLSNQVDFNTNETLSLTQDILENNLHITDDSTILTLQQSVAVSNILD